jgi:hypothetical protein
MIRLSQFLILIFLAAASCDVKKTNGASSNNDERNCCNGSDDPYNYVNVVQSFADLLNSLSPNYEGVSEKGFYLNNECKLIGAFIIDLTDTLNRATSLNECIRLSEGHVYHFAAIKKHYSFSNIAVLTRGKVTLFKAVSCPEKGDKLEDAVRFISDSLPRDKGNEIIDRVRNFRKYGVYIGVDEQSQFPCTH